MLSCEPKIEILIDELRTGDAVDGIRFDTENGPATFQNFPGDWADLNCNYHCQPCMQGCDITTLHLIYCQQDYVI